MVSYFFKMEGKMSEFEIWSTLNSGLAIGAQEILIPEVNMSFDNLINSLKKSKTAGKTSSIIVVAEGDKTGKNVFELIKDMQN